MFKRIALNWLNMFCLSTERTETLDLVSVSGGILRNCPKVSAFNFYPKGVKKDVKGDLGLDHISSVSVTTVREGSKPHTIRLTVQTDTIC